mgnify:CR=1 FL=1
MKTISNPFGDHHGNGDVYTWTAPKGFVLSSTAVAALETPFGATLMARAKTDTVHGFIGVEHRNGDDYVTVHLYRTTCNDPECEGLHTSKVVAAVAPPSDTPSAALLVTGKVAIK